MKQMEAFADWIRGNGKSEKTLKVYTDRLGYWLAWLGKREPTIENAERFIAEQVKKKAWKPATLQSYRMAFRVWFKFKGEKIPEEKLKSIKVNSVREDKFVSLGEVNSLIEVSDNLRDKAIFRLLFHSGVRASELLEIRARDLNLDMHYLDVHGIKGSHKIRRVRFIRPELCVPTMRAYLKKYGLRDNDRLFNFKYDNLRFIVANYRGAIGKPDLSAHWFRHGFVVWCKENGVPAEVTAMQIGDTVLVVQQIYSHFSHADVNRVFDQLEGKISIPKEKDPIDEIVEMREHIKQLEGKLTGNGQLGDIVIALLEVVAKDNPSVKEKFRELVREKKAEGLFV